MKKKRGIFPFNKMFGKRKDDDPMDDVYAGPKPIECVYDGPTLIEPEPDVDFPEEDALVPEESEEEDTENVDEEEKCDPGTAVPQSEIDVSKIEKQPRQFMCVYAAPVMMDKMSRHETPAVSDDGKEKVKYCPSCGMPLKKTDKFCAGCGEKIDK